MDIFFANPLGWVQHQLLGGWRRSLVIGFVYLCLGLGVLLFITRVMPIGLGTGPTSKQFAGVALLILLGVQSLLMLIAGGGWVRRAVQRDFAGNMIDSHRLTPMSGWTTVFGYIIGPNLTFVPLTGVNLLFSIGFSIWGGYSWWSWLLGLCVVACAAAAVSTLSLLMALSTRGSANIVGLIIMGSVMGGGALMFLIPGLGLLAGSFSIISMLRASGGALRLDSAIIIPIFGQLALALIVGKAAARKSLRSDVQGFSWPLGLLMFSFVCVFGGLGLRLWTGNYAARLRNMSFMEAGPQWIATLTAITLFALLPLSAVIQQRVVWDRHKLHYPEGAGPQPMSWLGVFGLVMLAAAAIARITLGGDYLSDIAGDAAPAVSFRVGLTLAILALAILPIVGIMQIVYRVREKVTWFVVAWIVAAWAALPIIDLLIAAYREDAGSEPMLTWLTGCSPVGAWAMIWLKPKLNFYSGLILQAVLAVVVGLLLPRMRRKAPPVLARGVSSPA